MSPETRTTRERFRRGTSGFEERSRSYLQERLRLFCFVGFAIGAVLYVAFRLISLVSLDEYPFQSVGSTRAMIHLSATALSGLLWWILGRHALSSRSLLACDATAIWVDAAACILIVALHPKTDVGTTAFILGIFLLARAVIVPSSVRRTVAVSTVPVIIFGVILLTGSPHSLTDPYPSEHVGTIAAVLTSVLGTAVLLAATASYVTFRLRREVYEAEQLGQYVLEEKIGEGGMGEVHRARHAMLRRPTAIKLLRSQHLDRESLQRFEREVWMTSRLTHANTIGIYDYGRTPDGVFYYAMELLEGANLEEVLQVGGPMPGARLIHVLRQACGALSEAHAQGLVHRDIKPANLFLCERGGMLDVVKVMDFGLVKKLSEQDSKLTQAGTVVGTPQYFSPELLSGEGVGAPADLYSLGAVAYELAAGKVLFDADSVGAIIVAHLQTQPTPPSAHVSGLSADLERVILRCLEKEPADRYESAAALGDALLGCEEAGRWTQEDARAWWERHLPDRLREPLRV